MPEKPPATAASTRSRSVASRASVPEQSTRSPGPSAIRCFPPRCGRSRGDLTVRPMDTVRIGILGAARIAPAAAIKPARKVAEATIGAVAARDRSRAQAFATKHGIPTVHENYQALIADPNLDAIYNPLPNGLHAEWTIAALEAGKHVLCEKPFTANTKEAEAVAAVAASTGLVVMEAFHYRYHPLAHRMREIVDSGELGTTRHVEAALCFPLPKFSDIRYRYDLAGGATM